MSVGVLELLIEDHSGRWRLVLSEDGGRLAEHTVTANLAGEEYAAFVATEDHVEHQRVADRSASAGVELARRVGDWITESILGPLGGAIAERAPCTVVVRGTAPLIGGPWALARVAGQTLAEHGVVIVEAVPEPMPRRRPEVAGLGPIRVLALFSQPDGLDALNLRKERQDLSRVVRDLVERHGRAVELRVLQYGVTRKALEQVAADPRGWDIVHLAGHGTAMSFALEASDGTRDPVPIDDLVALLVPARPQLVCISSCQSAGQAADEHLVRLGLRPTPQTTQSAVRTTSLAHAVADRLGCAVVAMRFAVSDAFGIALTGALYRALLADGLPLARALGKALEVAGADAMPLDLVTPVLLGEHSTHLVVKAPAASGGEAESGQDPLPAQPVRFVGRVGTMTRSTHALVHDTGPRAIVLHGMPGSGKSTIATELAHILRDRFDEVVWCAIPDGADARTALAELTVQLEAVLPGLHLVHLLDEPAEFSTAAVTVSSALAQTRTLIVVDNLEAWAGHPGLLALLAAMAHHDGPARTVITTREAPTGLSATVERVGPLDRDEAVLLATELRRLARFVKGAVPDVPAESARSLARRVILAADGHPKLLELADGQAGDVESLRRLLADTKSPDAGVAAALKEWTTRVTATLSTSTRRAFDLLCMLTERDRTTEVVADVCAALGTPPPDPTEISSTGLTELDGAGFRIHPAVAATGRGLLTGAERNRLTTAITQYWTSAIENAVDDERAGGSTEPVARSARSAVTYLLDAGDVRTATDALDLVLRRERSPVALSTLIPLIHQLVAAATESDDRLRARRLLANVMSLTGHPSSDTITERLRADALAAGNLEMATVLTSDLISRLRQANRLTEALELAEEQITLGTRVGVGAWTRLLHDTERINLLVTLGRAKEVTAEVAELRDRMSKLSPEAEDSDTVRPFWVRELVLDTVYTAALAMRDYRTCLEVGEEVISQKKARGADETEVARATYRTCYPLMRLGRLTEAASRLTWCRPIFTRHADMAALAATYTALAEIEEAQGRPRAGVELCRAALRHQYAARTVGGIVNGHLNLGFRLAATGAQSAAIPHHLLAVLIAEATGYWQGTSTMQALSDDLIAPEEGIAPPTTLDELWRRVGDDVPDLDVPATLRVLNHGVNFTQDDLDQVLAAAQTRAMGARSAALAFWDPPLSGLMAGAEGREATEDFLDAVSADPGWAVLAAAVRTPDEQPAGLDAVDSVVLERAHRVLKGELRIGPDLWHLLPWADLLANVVGATHGRADRRATAEAQFAAADDIPELVSRLKAVLAGERDITTLTAGLSIVDRQAVECVLSHAGR